MTVFANRLTTEIRENKYNLFLWVFMLRYWCLCVLRISFACKCTLLDTIFEINETTVVPREGHTDINSQNLTNVYYFLPKNKNHISSYLSATRHLFLIRNKTLIRLDVISVNVIMQF